MTPETLVGTRIELTAGSVAHGGHCVARAEDGRVVFVRHTLPGERVLAEVTEERTGYLRADAVEILAASPDRVVPPCPYAGPDRCGGCDFQHVAPAAQRELKRAVVIDALRRIGGMTNREIDLLGAQAAGGGRPGIRVEALPGSSDGLGWRTRVRYTIDSAGRAGLLKNRSHEVVAVDECVIAHPAIRALPVTSREWPDDDEVEVIASGAGDVVVLAGTAGRTPRLVEGPTRVRERAAGREWRLDPSAFWQIHPAAADTLCSAAMAMLAPVAGERAWDLYGGAGVFAAALSAAVGPRGRVTLVESDRRAVASARESLADLRNVSIVDATVEKARLSDDIDIVLLDPPRSGAGTRAVRLIADARPRAVAYVACDPAAFARDVAMFRDERYHLERLRVFDAFPMTHHIECIGLLVPGR